VFEDLRGGSVKLVLIAYVGERMEKRNCYNILVVKLHPVSCPTSTEGYFPKVKPHRMSSFITPTMEVVRTSETSVYLNDTTRRYLLEEYELVRELVYFPQNYCFLRSYIDRKETRKES
jgi:hypothetical protein